MPLLQLRIFREQRDGFQMMFRSSLRMTPRLLVAVVVAVVTASAEPLVAAN
jgi:hypothetical protein